MWTGNNYYKTDSRDSPMPYYKAITRFCRGFSALRTKIQIHFSLVLPACKSWKLLTTPHLRADTTYQEAHHSQCGITKPYGPCSPHWGTVSCHIQRACYHFLSSFWKNPSACFWYEGDMAESELFPGDKSCNFFQRPFTRSVSESRRNGSNNIYW